MKMTYKQIEASREARLWIGQIIVPAISLAAVLSTPEQRHAAVEKARNVKQSFSDRINKIRKKA